MRDLSYEACLRSVGLPTLAYRRYRGAGLFFFRKKCISSGTPGGKWKIAISSNFFRKKLEGMEDIGRIIIFSIGCSKYVVWNNKRYLAYFTKIVKIGKPFQDDNFSFVFVYLHIYGEAQLHLPASQVHARLIRRSNYPGFGTLSKKYHNTVCGISCMSYTLTVKVLCALGRILKNWSQAIIIKVNTSVSDNLLTLKMNCVKYIINVWKILF